MWYNNILETVGNTPLIRLNSVASHVKATILAKVEYFNPGNSTKDRIAIKMVMDAERKGLLKPGGTIIECTSGNTGMGLALVAAVRGYRCVFTMSDKMSKEKVDALKAVGAEVIICPSKVPADDPRSYYQTAARLAQEIPNSFFPFQYHNLSNTQAHYETTGPEIWRQTEGKITHFVAGMGTCGTIVGVSRYLKEQNPNVFTIGVDTYGSLFKTLHETGKVDESEIYPYLVEGIGEDMIPQNYDGTAIDRVIKVTDKDSALMARRLARMEGLFVGYSSGSAVYGALQYAAAHLKRDDVMVVLLPDHGTRYLGKIYNDDWMREQNFLEEGALMTADQIISTKPARELLFVAPETPIALAVEILRKNSISQLPVMSEGRPVGSLNESRLLNALIDDPALKDAPVSTVMDDPFPFVLPGTRIDVIGKMISSVTPAVLVDKKDEGYHIITKSDLIQALSA
ncbi:MAG: pyridoxal-phosphate dependent enzyme [Bacteroidia bacterium]|nr:pyridoxal-phosphate dependent enzyme [Bacteroidia bacterium]MDW8332648.1 pyridoxal-phosphate dependent enzyme [Bacteroidia bacterium]